MAHNRRRKPVRTSTLFIRGLRRDVKDGYKAWCSLRGLSMTRDLESYMLGRMNEDKPTPPTNELS